MAPRLWLGIGEMVLAGIYSMEITNHDDLFSEVERFAEGYQGKKFCISRLPQRTLLRHLSLDEYDCYWLSEQDTPQSIPPSTEAMHQLLNSFIQDEYLGLSVVEGLNWIVQREGIDSVMNLLQRIETLTASSNHTILFPMDALAFDAIDWARIRSIAPAMEQTSPTEVFDLSNTLPALQSESNESSTHKAPQILAHLTTLPSLGFNKTQLSKRMLQWKRMGFDVSDLEPALSLHDSNEIHQIYRTVEEKIRTGVELARLLVSKKEKIDVTTFEVTMFRIMQLTGLDEIESMLHGLS
jgi:hypothetical protein